MRPIAPIVTKISISGVCTGVNRVLGKGELSSTILVSVVSLRVQNTLDRVTQNDFSYVEVQRNICVCESKEEVRSQRLGYSLNFRRNTSVGPLWSWAGVS